MTKPLVLIIEDEQDLAEIFSLALQSVGFEIEIIANGDTALARLAEATPDLVVLDLHLPRVAGGKILQYIRADERLAKTRVMLATADALTAEKLRGEADLILLQPISIDQLQLLATRLRRPDTSD